jgi:hypothetical protein
MKKIRTMMVWAVLLGSLAMEKMDGDELFAEVVKRVNALQDCRVKFKLYSSWGKDQAVHSLAFEEAEYLREPRLYYQRRTRVEANYKEQGGSGFQEIYRGSEDISELLMPGALRALGLIKLFPEDPKGFGMNGGNLKTMAPWDMVNGFERMARLGKVSVTSISREGKSLLVFDIVQNPGTYYFSGVNRGRLFVDAKTLLPLRFEWWYPGQSEAECWLEYQEFAADTGLKPEDIAFEGFKSPFSLIKSPSLQEIEPYLKPLKRTRVPDPAPDFQAVLERFRKAVDGLDSYRADLAMSFRYGRLRLYREDRFAYHKNPYWFTLVTTAQKADYLLLNHSAGAVLWLEPSDRTFHIIGGGVQRLLGEQVFSESDYKFYSSLGDNPYELDFPRILAMLESSFTSDRGCWFVEYQGRKMIELKAERHPPGLMRAPARLNLILDPESSLPAAVEFTGYDDPQAFMAMSIKNIQTPLTIKPGETRF